MISSKKDVQVLAALMLKKGISDVVISPGSRNAPLINTFDSLPEFRCFNVVDERSAAFFAMGLALKLGRPVAVACTSGSAMLNYAPAVAEAFYQKIPLVVLSADRPKAWVDQGDGQTIRQEGALDNFVKKSVSLSGDMRDEQEEWYNTRLLNKALNAATDGPVHINMPFAEPLYDLVDTPLPTVKSIDFNLGQAQMDDSTMEAFRLEWQQANKKMIIVGQMQPNAETEALLNDLANNDTAIILTEKTSNIQGDKILSSIDNLLSANDDSLAPDLLITLGDQIVSKKVKAWLRVNKPKGHWHFSKTMEVQDTFMALTRVIAASPTLVLATLGESQNKDYTTAWQSLEKETRAIQESYVKDAGYCDLKVFGHIMDSIPSKSVLHLSNSTPVRYAQLFPMKDMTYQSNRGTSGIDGVISTASGFAHDDERLNVLLVGDLSFFYDSNALWNKHLPNNLKIILINNEGGGIFRFIDGPSKMEASEEHFVAAHQTKAEGLVKSFGVAYNTAQDEPSLRQGLEWLYSQPKTAVLEVFTPADENAQVLRDYFKTLQKA